MNQKESGKLIAKLRKAAGYTQRSLAEALFVTDKAVSKWERGICLPDASLLTRLSMLLDADIEYLISGEKPYGRHKWVGELRVKNLEGMIAGRPILHYLLSYFMLIGITDITIVTDDKEYVKTMKLEEYGLNISFESKETERTMLVYDKFLLFGVNITRQLEYCLSNEQDMELKLHGVDIPILFKHNVINGKIKNNRESVEIKSLGRGTIYIPLDTEDGVKDAETFVELYEKHHKVKISDLNEIAILRRLI